MLVLGLSAGFHDAAAAVVADGELVAAVEQERLSRVKHDASFPDAAIDTALAVAGAEPTDVDLVVHHERPVSVVDRFLAARLRTGPAGWRPLMTETPAVVRTQLGVAHRVARHFADRGCAVPPLAYGEHHLSHAASAYFPSPFDDAAVLVVDGVGEWATTSTGSGRGSAVALERRIDFPHSLGLLYSAFTEYCGFRPNGGEGELMGLAPFGTPRYREAILDHLVQVGEDGSFRLDLSAFTFLRGRHMTGRRFAELFGGPRRPRGAVPGQREADLAASVQEVLGEVLVRIARDLRGRTSGRALCLAGGVALNCVANSLVVERAGFDEVWVQPAAGDAGAAVGAALWGTHAVAGVPRTPRSGDGMSGAFLGPAFADDEVRRWLDHHAIAHREAASEEALCEEVAGRLADGAVVGWFQGRMEFGPRALGHRSILADARSPVVQSRLNSMVKERADFRPFAPAVLEDRCEGWFEPATPRPYMTFVSQVAGGPSHRGSDPDGDDGPATHGAPSDRVREVRGALPAVTHVDWSARVQTVDPVRNPEFGRLLTAFERRTGCPVLLNTSFNGRDEPIVCTPDDALRTFRSTGLDLLAVGPFLVEAGA